MFRSNIILSFMPSPPFYTAHRCISNRLHAPEPMTPYPCHPKPRSYDPVLYHSGAQANNIPRCFIYQHQNYPFTADWTLCFRSAAGSLQPSPRYYNTLSADEIIWSCSARDLAIAHGKAGGIAEAEAPNAQRTH